MARRRKLEAPNPDDLANFEARFRRETGGGPTAPIGVMAADAASATDPRDGEARAEAERIRKDAAYLAEARSKGLVIEEIPLADIVENALVRDRAVVDEADLAELTDSIANNGLRLPIEVFPLEPTASGRKFGLLSGFRRLLAIRQLARMSDAPKYAIIKAIIRSPVDSGARFAAMVEENEVRAGLSHFERGRIAVIAAGQGGFASTDAAVDALFASASKAKRSKVRSFALIFEELGDLLVHPEAMTERQGLRLAAALRADAEPALREALAVRKPESFADEWAAMEPAILVTERRGKQRDRGGRPRRTKIQDEAVRETGNGWTLRARNETASTTIQIDGGALDRSELEELIERLAVALSS